MIEIYPPYKGTNTTTGFEVQVIGIATKDGELMAICIGEEGELYWVHAEHVHVDWRYKRPENQWVSINDVEEPAQEP